MLPNQACSSRSNSSSETKSLASGRSLARSLRVRRLRLLRVPGQVELLVMVVGERTVAGGDGVVAARLDLHVVRRIGVDQVDRRRRPAADPRPPACCCRRRAAGGRPGSTGRPACVIASSGGSGTSSGSVSPSFTPGIEQLGQLVLVEKPSSSRSKSMPCSSRQLDRQQLVVPRRPARPSCCRRCGRP